MLITEKSLTSSGVTDYMSDASTVLPIWGTYLIPIYGPIKFWIDTFTINSAIDTTASKGYYDYTKSYLSNNYFDSTTAYNVMATISRFYTNIQRQRELTSDETNNANELLTLLDSRTSDDTTLTTAPRNVPSPVDYGASIPPVVTVPDFNPLKAVSDTIMKYKWAFIGAGGLITVYFASTVYKNFKGAVK